MATGKRILGAAVLLFGAVALMGVSAVGATKPRTEVETGALAVKIAKDGTVQLDSGVVTVRGTVTCSEDAVVFLQGDLTQTSDGPEPTYVHFSDSLACSGTTAWSITTDYSPVRFAAGWVAATAAAEIENVQTGQYAYDEARTVVRLRKAR